LIRVLLNINQSVNQSSIKSARATANFVNRSTFAEVKFIVFRHTVHKNANYF